jgi:hypothetical protein
MLARMRNRTRARLLLASSLLALCAACATPVRTDYDPSFDFSGYRTWAWLPQERERTGNPRLDSALLRERILRAVEAELTARGYQKVDPERADFLVGYHVTLEQKLDSYTIDRFYGYSPYWGGGVVYAPETVVEAYEEGTLILDVVDPHAQKLVWRGATSRRVYDNPDPEKSDERVREATRAILEKFPPVRKGS